MGDGFVGVGDGCAGGCWGLGCGLGFGGELGCTFFA